MRKLGKKLLLLAVLYYLSAPLTYADWTHKSSTPDRPRRLTEPQLRGMYDNLPLSFEANAGQSDRQVKFLSRGQGYTLFLTGNEAVLALRPGENKSRGKSQKSKAQLDVGGRQVAGRNPNFEIENRNSFLLPRQAPLDADVLRLRLVGANPSAHIAGLEELSGKTNYFIGDDPREWRSNIPTYRKVAYQGIYPGIDLVYYGNQRQLEYDFIVAPGSNPDIITLGFDGVVGARRGVTLRIDAQGDLVVQTGGSEVRFHKPVVYQPTTDPGQRTTEDVATKHFLKGSYALKGRGQIGFELAGYDPGRPLIIDPVLIYSTYLGGSGPDTAYGLAVDSSGNAYLTGSTQSANFPTANPFQAAIAGGVDVFVTKLNATGSALVYSTYLGGSGFDLGTGIAVDSAGNAYVTGYTSSANFPTAGSIQPTFGGGNDDAFVAKLDPSGSVLVYSFYLGGSDDDFGHGIAVDSSGNAYVTGSTKSTNFPIVNPLQPANAGSSDAFVTKVSSDGSRLVYSTFLGGSGADSGQGIAVDASGNAYVTGYTFSLDYPTTAGALQGSNGGGSDAFVAKLNPGGSALVYSTYLGGSGLDRGFAIAIDSTGNAYVTGDTQSSNFPTTVGAFSRTNAGNGDAFVAKLNTAGSMLVYSTFLGGTDVDQGFGISVDSSNRAFVTGLTQSANFPVRDPLQASIGGGTCGASPCSDAFVTELDAQGALLPYSTFLGGTGADSGLAIVLDSSGNNAYVAGGTASSDFPPVSGAFQPVYGGGNPSGGDAFAVKINAADAPAVALSPQQMTFGDQAVGTTSAAQKVTLTNAGSLQLTITSIVASGDFAQTNTCVSPIRAAGGTCAINVTFTPTATDNRTGSITITDNAAGSPHRIALTGNGTPAAPAVTFSPSSLAFGNQVFGTSSAPRPVTLTNSGSAPLSITDISGTGEFTQTHNCPVAPATLAPRANCTINVTFTPTGTGNRTGTIAVTDNTAGSSDNLSTSGTGIAVFTLSSDASSTSVLIGSSSATFNLGVSAPGSFTDSVTLSCTSGATCSFNPASITAGQTSALTVSGLSTTSPNPLVFSVTGTSGSQTASLQLMILLLDFSIAASPPLMTIVAGQTANYTLTITPANGFNQAVALACSFTNLPTGPLGAGCSINPTSVTPSGPVMATVTVTTTAHSIVPPGSKFGRRPRPFLPFLGGRVGFLGALWLLTLATFAAWSKRAAASRGRPRHAWLGVSVIILLVMLWAACSSGGPPALTGTPYGNYNLTLTGTVGSGSSAVTRGTTVNLSVGN